MCFIREQPRWCRKFYQSACVHAKNLPKSETKSELIKYSKQLVKQYQALKKAQTQQNDYAARQRLFSDKKNDQEATLLVDEANQLEIKLWCFDRGNLKLIISMLIEVMPPHLHPDSIDVCDAGYIYIRIYTYIYVYIRM